MSDGTRRFDPEGVFVWVGIALIAYGFHGAIGAGLMFLLAAVISSALTD